VFSLLTSNADDLDRLVAGLSEEQLNRKPAGVDWSLRDHIAHFFDTQDMLDARVELMLQQENPELKSIAVYAFATEEQRHPHREGDAGRVQRAAEKMRCTIERFAIQRLVAYGWHTEFGRITILRQAAYIAYHEQTHLPDIEALRRHVG